MGHYSFRSSNGRVAIRGAARQAKAERTSPTMAAGPSPVGRFKGSARRGAVPVGRGRSLQGRGGGGVPCREWVRETGVVSGGSLQGRGRDRRE